MHYLIYSKFPIPFHPTNTPLQIPSANDGMPSHWDRMGCKKNGFLEPYNAVAGLESPLGLGLMVHDVGLPILNILKKSR